jgi:hypothetical protein
VAKVFTRTVELLMIMVIMMIGLIEIYSQGSSVSIVYGYRLDDRAIEVRSPAETRGFFL